MVELTGTTEGSGTITLWIGDPVVRDQFSEWLKEYELLVLRDTDALGETDRFVLDSLWLQALDGALRNRQRRVSPRCFPYGAPARNPTSWGT